METSRGPKDVEIFSVEGDNVTDVVYINYIIHYSQHFYVRLLTQ